MCGRFEVGTAFDHEAVGAEGHALPLARVGGDEFGEGFLFALLFLVEKRENWTVSLGLSQLAGSIEVPTTVLMAGAVILTVPIVLVFFVSERFLVGGLTAGAEKG